MNKIDSCFYNELFEKKRVKFHCTLYNHFYWKIWPCEEQFKLFLLAGDPSMKLDYAKKVYEHMQTCCDIILPAYYMNNVISIQMKKLVDNHKYVPQDHVIHSVYVYILGVYLFFNVPLLFQKLMEKQERNQSIYQKTDRFINNWQLFALYHDIGYYLEANMDNTGYYGEDAEAVKEEYDKLCNRILYHSVLRSTAKLISLIALLYRSNRSFHLSDFENQTLVGFHTSAEENNLTRVLSKYEGATELKDVTSYAGFQCFHGLFCDKTYLIAIENEYGAVMGLVIVANSKIDKLFHRKHQLEWIDTKQDWDTMEFLLSLPDTWKCRFYLPTVEKTVEDAVPITYRKLVFEFYDDLPLKLHEQFSFIQGDQSLRQCVQNIYEWLHEKTFRYADSNSFENSREIFIDSMSQHYKTALKERINLLLETQLDGSVLEHSNLDKVLDNFFKSSQKKCNFTTLLKEIQIVATEKFNASDGVSQNILSYCGTAYAALTQSLLKPKDSEQVLDWKALSFIKASKTTLSMDIFAHDQESTTERFEKALYQNIRQQAERLNIEFEQLISYTPDYTNCDHGLASAAMLYQAAAVRNALLEYTQKRKDMRLIWNQKVRLPDDRKIMLEDASSVVFSVLLHNIYSGKEKSYGISYKQNIDTNPFCYFCAFCDVLQVWNRPKQIDYAQAGLPQKHFLNGDFDLRVLDGKILFECSAEDAVALKEKILESEIYLPGCSRLIQITERGHGFEDA